MKKEEARRSGIRKKATRATTIVKEAE